MKIVKRNGVRINFAPNKILTRIKKTATGLNVNSDALAIEVQTYLYDGITTREIDDQTAKLAAQSATNHPDYSLLASRIMSSKMHKDLGTGVEVWKERLKDHLKQEVFDKQALWGVEPDYSYDDSFDFLGISSFNTVYGLKKETYDPIKDIKTEELIELPCEMMFRVALYLSETKEEFETNYQRLTNRKYGGATPVLINAGTHNSSMISCSVNEVMDDSLEGIHDTMKSISQMSKDGAGIGLWAGRLRSDQTRYAGKGKAGGIQRFGKIVDMNLRFFKQQESRRGKGALYLNLWHRDLYKFIELASKEGSEETTARDLMTAVIINDLFYQRLLGDKSYKGYINGEYTEQDGMWSLFCPHEVYKQMGFNLYDYHTDEFEQKYIECELNPNLPRTTVKCDDIIRWICNMQSKSGHPYVLNIDNVNRVNNQKNYGIIKMSQLCVSGDTEILTDKGNIVIGEHVGEYHNIWNGHEFSNVEILKTSDNEKLTTVTILINEKNNKTVKLNTTSYHRWFINEEGEEVEKQTKDLKVGDVLIDYKVPVIAGKGTVDVQVVEGAFVGHSRCKIIDIEETNINEPVYCVKEPLRQRAVFNGILTGNCIEIMQYTAPDISAQCCLGALMLGSYVRDGKFDLDELRENAGHLNYMLNRVIDKNQWSNEYSERGGKTQRATAVGVAGLADVFYMLDISFDSPEAKQLNKEIFENIYYGAIEGSIKYREDNPEVFTDELKSMLDGTELGQGRFVWEKYDDVETTLDWEGLRLKLGNGISNSMLCGLMPTASSSTLAMQNEMYEPMQDIAVVRKTVSGEFPFINKYLINDLTKKGIYNEDILMEIKYLNSLQEVDFFKYTDDIEWINHMRSKYKTIWEMPQRLMIELASDRQRFVDQGQSMNLYWADPTLKKLTSALVAGWRQGLKTGVYYTKARPKKTADKSLGLGIVKTNVVPNIVDNNDDFVCDGCSS